MVSSQTGSPAATSQGNGMRGYLKYQYPGSGYNCQAGTECGIPRNDNRKNSEYVGVLERGVGGPYALVVRGK